MLNMETPWNWLTFAAGVAACTKMKLVPTRARRQASCRPCCKCYVFSNHKTFHLIHHVRPARPPNNCKRAGSFHIHRKTMKELCILAVLGIREWPNLAQNLVTHWHWWKNIFCAMTLPLWRVFGQNLVIFACFWAFSVTFLAVTAINMLTLGTGRTCIFYGHIPSWFEAVLAIAMLQSWTRGPQKWVIFGSKSGHNGRVGLGQGSIVGTLKHLKSHQY